MARLTQRAGSSKLVCKTGQIVKTVPLAEATAKLSGLIDGVARRDERFTITKHGRPAAVIMSLEEATSLDATLEIMSDPEFYAEILRNRRALDRGKGRACDLDEILGEDVSTPSCEVGVCGCFERRPTWRGSSPQNPTERCAQRSPRSSKIPTPVSRSNARRDAPWLGADRGDHRPIVA